ncbi:hypothetical protein C7974DRAFT_453441 [Boeremia exigua]|uniref:uncharacterized protein n=1 Tax=Boeremia exigua TaxID=749465 RepID=UPI001E8E0CAB|nr:uncharacterized protein C7974DRAFT_453441 [Boeremia exigua]KAH6628964.1 hypothetical protein C7974DRAFT_453441 [Boeremia exigua]
MATQYESVHQAPKGPGDARPTALQIIKDNQLHGQWSDKTILITGCSSGIGIETAKALADTGATLYLTARDLAKAKSALGSLLNNDRVHLLELDLNSLASVRRCADDFLTKSPGLNVLIANAGVMATPEGRTVDGFEVQFGTNHLAHFLLIQLLLPTLLKSSSANFNSRVVILSSSAHRHGGINFDNLNFDGDYNPWIAYSQSKTANLYTATEIERRYGDQGVHAWSVHPRLIGTGLMKFLPDETLAHPEQGAATTVWAAAAKALQGQGGRYLKDCQISKPAKDKPEEYKPRYAAWAYDKKKERML